MSESGDGVALLLTVVGLTLRGGKGPLIRSIFRAYFFFLSGLRANQVESGNWMRGRGDGASECGVVGCEAGETAEVSAVWLAWRAWRALYLGASLSLGLSLGGHRSLHLNRQADVLPENMRRTVGNSAP